MLNFNGNNNSNGALNLGVSNNQPSQSMQNPFGNQQMQGMSQNPFMQGMVGEQNSWMQQPVAPPSELEIQIMLLRGIVPVDRFLASESMGTLVQMFNNIVTFSVLEVFKNASFVADDDGNLKMDVSSLPSHLQTMSSENIQSNFTALQSAAKQNVQMAEQNQMQLNTMAQQSMMGGALQAALADEGMMRKVGGGVGNFARNFITGSR
jgi:hypothetical protein|tara:strand:+ start:4807 stop:5427 length:621 start_codon:yes stop_codon:yes gene_type:complete